MIPLSIPARLDSLALLSAASSAETELARSVTNGGD